MMSREEARRIAGRAVEDEENAIDDGATVETEHCWVFFWNSKEFLQTRDFNAALMGNAPVIVSKLDGSLVETGTGRPWEHYVKRYERRQRPWWRIW
jgi:hypothetical protein